jgi:alginate O-acetyltransferase complex protein AlgI
MVFSEPIFLFAFLPLALALYYAAPGNNLKLAALVLSSLFFYVWGERSHALFLAAVFLIDVAIVRWMRRSPAPKMLLGIGIAANLLILFYFKYGFFVLSEVVDPLLGADLVKAWRLTQPSLPIGISFIVFHSVSYLVDTYRSRLTSSEDHLPLHVGVYLTAFPQLVAGPIIRYHQIADQISHRSHTADKFFEGAVRFCHGLFKKVVIADTCALVADAAFGMTGDRGAIEAWLGLAAYTMQVYFDFSGYSDMAIGLGLMLGFRYPENFNRPYSAVSMTDFWRRWHMTLTGFFRDYVYIPLGGNKEGLWRTSRNILFVFLLTGIWHGAGWTFVLWGVLHGCILVLERITGQATDATTTMAGWKRVSRRVYTLLAVMLLWVLFRAPDLHQAGQYYLDLIDLRDLELSAPFLFLNYAGEGITAKATLTYLNILVIGLGALIFIAGAGPRAKVTFGPALPTVAADGPMAAVKAAYAAIALAVAIFFVLRGAYSPFIYFNF